MSHPRQPTPSGACGLIFVRPHAIRPRRPSDSMCVFRRRCGRRSRWSHWRIRNGRSPLLDLFPPGSNKNGRRRSSHGRRRPSAGSAPHVRCLHCSLDIGRLQRKLERLDGRPRFGGSHWRRSACAWLGVCAPSALPSRGDHGELELEGSRCQECHAWLRNAFAAPIASAHRGPGRNIILGLLGGGARRLVIALSCGASHTWHGHLAHHASSPAVALAEWRSARWWWIVQELAAASDVHTGWRHPRRCWAKPLCASGGERIGRTPHRTATLDVTASRKSSRGVQHASHATVRCAALSRRQTGRDAMDYRGSALAWPRMRAQVGLDLELWHHRALSRR